MHILRIVWVSLAYAVSSSATEEMSQEELSENVTTTYKLSLHPPDHNIVLVGYRSEIRIFCEKVEEEICVAFQPQNENMVKIVNDQLLVSPNETGSTKPRLKLLGMRPGNTRLNVSILHAQNRSYYRPLTNSYLVTVVSKVDLLNDAFLYVLCIVQFLTLLMLGSRIRGCAVREILKKPRGIIAAALCQAMFLPLVGLGASLSLSLRVHSILCMLIVGCCPTSVLTPMFAVLQHAHVELSIVLLVIQTIISYGVMPFWLWSYGHFLGLAYHNLSFPYFHITGAVGYTAAPIVIGFLLQKCAPQALAAMDKAIHPTCLILTLTTSTVSIHSIWLIWDLVTWRLMVASVMVPIVGCLLGTLGSLIFRLKMPSIKTVAIATGLQNTILASILIDSFYPAPDASLMAITVVALEFTSLCFMYVLYITHLLTWLFAPSYRKLHESLGVGGFYRSLAERIAKSMIKAGEITFSKRHQPSDKTAITMATNSPSLSDKEKTNVGFDTLKGIGNKVLLASRDSMRRNQQSMSSKLGNDLGLNYFCPDTPDSDRKSESRDSLSIDYDMLHGNKGDRIKGEQIANIEPLELDSESGSTRGGASTAETYSVEGATQLASADKGDLILSEVNLESYTSRM